MWLTNVAADWSVSYGLTAYTFTTAHQHTLKSQQNAAYSAWLTERPNDRTAEMWRGEDGLKEIFM